jgi:TolB-like protein
VTEDIISDLARFRDIDVIDELDKEHHQGNR